MKSALAAFLGILVTASLFAALALLQGERIKGVYIPLKGVSIEFVREVEEPPKARERLEERRRMVDVVYKKPKVFSFDKLLESPFRKKAILERFPMEKILFDFSVNPELKFGLKIPPPPSNPFKGSSPKGSMGHVGDGLGMEQPPVLISSLKPSYPYRARRLGVEGVVVVKMLVGEDGRVKKVKILKADPPGFFEDAVISAVKSWRFVPAKEDGKPVPCWVVKPIRFRLD